jgi:hypothetical protein
MRKTVLFLLLFITYLCTNAQNKTLSRTIKWESPKSISHYYDINQKNINKTSYLSFENACYNEQQNLIPYYYELIKVDFEDIKLSIVNVSYKTLSNYELKTLKNKIVLRNEIQFSYTISYKRKQPYLQLNMLPLRNNPATGEIEKVISFDIQVVKDNSLKGNSTKIANKSKSVNKFLSESILKSGKWVKMSLNEDGIYKLTYSEIQDLGFSNPESIKIYGNSSGILPVSNTEPCPDDLTSMAIYFEKDNDGIFNSGDYILFFAKGPDQWYYNEIDDFHYCSKHIYSENNYIFLTTDVGITNNITSINTPSGSPSEVINTYTDYLHHENELENVIESGQLWLGEHFDITTDYDFDFSFSNRIKTSPVKIRLALAARSGSTSSFNIKSSTTNISNPSIGSVNLSSYTSTYAIRDISNSNFISNADNIPINITYNKPSSSSEAWLDYITINTECELKLNNNHVLFSFYNSSSSAEIIEFQIQNANTSTKIWDITNPTNSKNLNKTLSGSLISVEVSVNPGLNQFIAFNSEYNFKSTDFVNDVTNQNLHSTNHKDMIIVSHPEFLSQANELANLHEEQDNLSVIVTTPEQIFNEFSSGTPDASAIRNFVKMIYNKPSATDTLKYLLLLGDGSYDHKSHNSGNSNYILTYQSENSLSPTESFVTDDFFGLLDDSDNVEASTSGLVDIGIGRFPVSSSIQAQQIVDKIKTYTNTNTKGDWLNSICFVGDDEDNNIHMRDADKIATFVDTTYPYFFINKIYLDAFPQESSASSESYPEVNRLINDQINNGILIFNYTGHGGENGLAHERVLSISDINSWVNSDKLSIFVTATCEFSRFDNPQFTSAGELVLLNPNGGSVALFSTTRLVYSSPNYILNSNFFNYVFEKDYKGNQRALGDIIRLAKNASGTANNKRNFTLLGDPALKMPLPELNIITNSINNNNAISITDTLKALSKVTIKGHIESLSKSPVTNYNGVIYPLVLDKTKTITTLANDGGNTMNFGVQNNILYKGKASVTNGSFQFSFVVPKDISYNFDYGKISYYSQGSSADAKGYFDNFIIGGSNENATADNIGPSFKLYINDESFVSGGITNENPILYAILSDSSGINTVGNGIGHDITATLDNNTNNLLLLNDYYESDIDDYQKGKIEYLFDAIDEGKHTLNLKVWDVYNNSSEQEIEFIVAESANLAIKNLLNYPNPFTENTLFYFDHNRVNEDLNVLIQIFTISGKLIKTINTIINSNGFRSDPISWNGLDDFGDHIGRGVYIYQIKVRTTDGETVKKTEKLVILK